MFIKIELCYRLSSWEFAIQNRKFTKMFEQLFVEQTEHVNCHYRKRHIQSPIKDLRSSFWQKWLTVPEAYSERSQTSKMKLFEKKIFSRPLFQRFTIYTNSSIFDVRLRSEYAPGTINHFRKRLHLDVWLDSRYASDMFKERQKLRKTCKGVIFRNTAAKTKNNIQEISEKNSIEKWFSSIIFSKFCKKSRSSHQRCSIKKTVLKQLFLRTLILKNTCERPLP